MNYERLESQAQLERFIAWCRVNRALVVFDEAHRAKRGAAGVSRGGCPHLVPNGQAPDGPHWYTPAQRRRRPRRCARACLPGRGARLAAGSPSTLRRAFCRITKDELGLPPLVPQTERVPMSHGARAGVRGDG